MAYSSLSIANAFIELAENEGKALTNMHLQKLVFFSHGYTLAFLNRPLTSDVIKAWTFGPVYSALYNTLRTFGRSEINQPIPGVTKVEHQSDEYEIITNVWETYKFHSAAQLSRISHNLGSPWSQIWELDKFGEIPDNITRAYYRRLIAE